jgi:hypothetical protein
MVLRGDRDRRQRSGSVRVGRKGKRSGLEIQQCPRYDAISAVGGRETGEQEHRFRKSRCHATGCVRRLAATVHEGKVLDKPVLTRSPQTHREQLEIANPRTQLSPKGDRRGLQISRIDPLGAGSPHQRSPGPCCNLTSGSQIAVEGFLGTEH